MNFHWKFKGKLENSEFSVEKSGQIISRHEYSPLENLCWLKQWAAGKCVEFSSKPSKMNNTWLSLSKSPEIREFRRITLITYAQYCIYQTAILKYRESSRVGLGVINTRCVVLSNLCCTILDSSSGVNFEKKKLRWN